MHARRGIVASCALSALFVAGSFAVDPASAAPGHTHAPGHIHAEAAPGHTHAETTADAHAEGDDDDTREHMEQDLAGTPVTEIEKKTAANAAKIQQATGVRPGTAVQKSIAAAADPGQAGSWSSVVDTPVVPVFQAVLPNGKVLIWDSVGDGATESYPDQTFTRAMVWNPADDSYKRVDVQGANIFCAGFAHLANGNILVAGGNADQALNGIVQTHVFDWPTETWTRGPDMAARRWYPSVAEMANGEAVIVGGGPATAEVYQTNGALRKLTNFTKYSAKLYPFMGSRPDTQLGLFGPYSTAYTITTSGDGVITGTSTRDAITRDYGSFSTYDIGKTLVVGGGSITEGGVAKSATKTAVVLNANTGLVPTVTTTGSLSTGRRQLNATILADGSVLATGGMTSAATNTLVDLGHAVTSAERWDPATGKWTILSSASRIREYHSAAVLLPDGRVMTGGGGVCGACVTAGYLEKNIEYFTPPYLYKHDGSGQLADRPVIATAPASVGINTNFTVTSSQAAGIRKVALIGLGDATHSIDQGQRYVPLKFSVSGTTLTVTGPPSGGVAPPGYYLLFVVDSAGVPSVAKTVQVAKGPSPLMSPARNGGGRCVDVPYSSITKGTYLQGYTCNGSKAQAATRLPADNSLRLLGNCADVPYSNFASNQKIWMYTCNSSKAQTWQFGTDGTIRPIANTTLCLAAASTAQSAAILLTTCTGATLQKWTW